MPEKKGMPITLNTFKDALDLVMALDRSSDKFILISDSGRYHINAHSLIGVASMIPHKNEKLWLVNNTHHGVYPQYMMAD